MNKGVAIVVLVVVAVVVVVVVVVRVVKVIVVVVRAKKIKNLKLAISGLRDFCLFDTHRRLEALNVMKGIFSVLQSIVLQTVSQPKI